MRVQRVVLVLVGLAAPTAFAGQAPAPSPGLDTARIETLTGAQGVLDAQEGVFLQRQSPSR